MPLGLYLSVDGQTAASRARRASKRAWARGGSLGFSMLLPLGFSDGGAGAGAAVSPASAASTASLSRGRASASSAFAASAWALRFASRSSSAASRTTA